MTNLYFLHFDGSCGPKNPGGTAAYGFTLSRGVTVLAEGHAVIGTGPTMSNNVAEYAGLYEGLAWFATMLSEHTDHGSVNLHVLGDSMLVINQMSGKWKAHGGLYIRNYTLTKGLVSELRKQGVRFTFEWIPREANTVCDDLSKAHLIETA